jgi:hypothetical protein
MLKEDLIMFLGFKYVKLTIKIFEMRLNAIVVFEKN